MIGLVREHWERIVFSLIGLCFVSFSIYFLWIDKLTEAIATFGMFFISFVLSSLSRFKRFKGLGIEAELWEDKKKEAASLIERLKKVVTIYSKEILMARAMSGRLGPHEGWKSHWNLFEKLTSEHKELGHSIDFTEERSYFEALFVFDIVSHISKNLFLPIKNGKAEAKKLMDTKFGSPIRDVTGYNHEVEVWRTIQVSVKDAFEVSLESNLAGITIDLVVNSKRTLSEHFEIDIHLDRDLLDILGKVSAQIESGNLEITDELIRLADPQK